MVEQTRGAGMSNDGRETGSLPKNAKGDDETEPEMVVRLDDSAQALIGQHLKAIYSEIIQERIPDNLLKLLDELGKKERQS